MRLPHDVDMHQRRVAGFDRSKNARRHSSDGWVAVLPAVMMDYFGRRNVSGLIGILYTSVAFGTLIGPSAAGFAFDLNHSYALPILASAAANIIAAIIVVATSKVAAPASEPARRY